MSGAWPKPRLVVSACLEFEACRYNGQSIRARFLHRLEPHAELIPICPEVEIGLGVPRPPVRLVSIAGATRMVQPETGRDVTDAMESFSRDFLSQLGGADGFLLKSRSPSCGPKDVKIYRDGGGPLNERVSGVFAEAVGQAFPHNPVEDEGRLTNYALRHHFLTRIFLGACLRELPLRISALVEFHARNKLLLLACDEVESRVLGRIVANGEGLSAEEVFRRYREGFARAISRAPRPGPVINTMLHAFGHLSTELVPAERRVFLDMLEDYRARRIPLHAPLALLRGWNARQSRDWLGQQTFFRPYPPELHDLADSAGDARVA